MAKNVWEFRGFILGSVKREFQLKYRNSLLGAAWAVVNPLAMIIVYTIIFAKIMKARLSGIDSAFAYTIYLCAGLIVWGLFAEILGRSQNMFIENANLLKKLNFPKLCLPTTVVINALLNFSIVFALFSIFLILVNSFPGVVYLALIPVLCILVLFTLGLGIGLGVLNVFFRDVGQLVGVVIQFWFWLTPIVYPESILPEFARPFVAYNPMAVLIEACQRIVVNAQWPDWYALGKVLVLAILLCILSLRLFRKRAGEMVDEL